jgi:branched-chain amino acid transport system ATP-binding protein
VSIEANNIVAGYDKSVDILNGVSISVKKSMVTAIFGPNGAGKSTLLKTIYGFIKPKRGSIFFDGNEVTGCTPYNLFCRGVAYIPQQRSIFPYMTVEENLMLGTWYIRKNQEEVKDAIERAFTEFPNLKNRRRIPASRLSAGEQKMLELARALVIKKKVLLVDEPSAGLAPKFAKTIYDELERLRETKVSILLVDQNVRQAMSISDYVYMLDLGRNKYEGTREEIERNLNELVKTWLKF